MKIKSGTIKNISKKLVAGALTFALVMVPLDGCDSVSIDSIKYTVSSGEVTKKGISNENLEYCYFYEVYNNKTKEKYYTIVFQDVWNGGYLIKYYDIFTEKQLMQSDFVIKYMDPIKKYLEEENLIKNEYTEEELKEILSNYVKTLEKSKKLVKE